MSLDQIDIFHDALESWTAPVWFSRGAEEPPAEVNDNGSCGFMRSGSNRFIVTACHVLEGFRAAKLLDPNTIFAVYIGGGNSITLSEPKVIAESQDLDIATIEFPHLDRTAGATAKSYFPLDRFPAIRASEGELATIVGYPGQGRHAFEAFGVFEPSSIGMIVASVSNRRITLADLNGQLKFERHGQHMVEGIRLGGFSGSPVFTMTLTNPRPNFVGVVSAGSECLGCQGQPGQVIVGSSEYLLPDGQLDWLRMPW